MTQPSQSELVETVLSILGIVDRTSGNRPEQIATLEQELNAYITANYTPNSTVESLNSQIAWLDGKVEEMREEVAEREQVARIDEVSKSLYHIRWQLNHVKPHAKNGLAVAERLLEQRIAELEKENV